MRKNSVSIYMSVLGLLSSEREEEPPGDFVRITELRILDGLEETV